MFIEIQDNQGKYGVIGAWVKIPSPTREMTHIITSYVNDARNEYGAVIGQIVGRANHKLDNLEWKMLDRKTIAKICSLVKPAESSSNVNERNFKFNLRIPNPLDYNATKGEFNKITLTAYSGDITIKPYWLNDAKTDYKTADLKVNFIDCGLASLIGDE